MRRRQKAERQARRAKLSPKRREKYRGKDSFF